MTEQQYRWHAESSRPDVGLAEVGGTGSYAVVRQLLYENLISLRSRYPASRSDIDIVTRTLLDTTPPGEWNRTFRLIGCHSSAVITMTLRKEPVTESPGLVPVPVPVSDPSRGNALRAGDAERERYISFLSEMYTDGHLDAGEFDRRMSAAHDAVYVRDLPRLVTDLPPMPSTGVESVTPVPFADVWLSNSVRAARDSLLVEGIALGVLGVSILGQGETWVRTELVLALIMVLLSVAISCMQIVARLKKRK
jgi:hypothetical protein